MNKSILIISLVIISSFYGCDRNSEKEVNRAALTFMDSLPKKIGVIRKLTADLALTKSGQEPWIRHEKYVVDYNHNIIKTLSVTYPYTLQIKANLRFQHYKNPDYEVDGFTVNTYFPTLVAAKNANTFSSEDIDTVIPDNTYLFDFDREAIYSREGRFRWNTNTSEWELVSRKEWPWSEEKEQGFVEFYQP